MRRREEKKKQKLKPGYNIVMFGRNPDTKSVKLSHVVVHKHPILRPTRLLTIRHHEELSEVQA